MLGVGPGAVFSEIWCCILKNRIEELVVTQFQCSELLICAQKACSSVFRLKHPELLRFLLHLCSTRSRRKHLSAARWNAGQLQTCRECVEKALLSFSSERRSVD